MIEIKCPKCNGVLKPTSKVIETVDDRDNYKIKQARLHECADCSDKKYVSIPENEEEAK